MQLGVEFQKLNKTLNSPPQNSERHFLLLIKTTCIPFIRLSQHVITVLWISMTENRTCLTNFVKTVHFNIDMPNYLDTDCQVTEGQVFHVMRLYYYIKKFLCNKSNRSSNFQIYSGTKLYMFRAVSLPIQVWRQLACRIRMENRDSARKLWSKLYNLCQCRMYSGKLLMMGRETARNM